MPSQSMMRNTATFVIAYILLMIPTYILPYFGSNSFAVNALLAASTHWINPLFIVHLLFLLSLVGITWLRGSALDKKWVVIFPVLALIFDLTPGLSLIILVPTVMHLLAIILGVIKSAEVEPAM